MSYTLGKTIFDTLPVARLDLKEGVFIGGSGTTSINKGEILYVPRLQIVTVEQAKVSYVVPLANVRAIILK